MSKSHNIERGQPLNDSERNLWQFLNARALGVNNARNHSEITAEAGLSYAVIQRAALNLVLKGYALGSSEGGLFACKTASDYAVALSMVEQYIWPLMRRRESLQTSLEEFEARQRRRPEPAEPVEQGALF